MMSLTSAWIATFCKIICNFNLSTLLKVILHDNGVKAIARFVMGFT